MLNKLSTNVKVKGLANYLLYKRAAKLRQISLGKNETLILVLVRILQKLFDKENIDTIFTQQFPIDGLVDVGVVWEHKHTVLLFQMHSVDFLSLAGFCLILLFRKIKLSLAQR